MNYHTFHSVAIALDFDVRLLFWGRGGIVLFVLILSHKPNLASVLQYN